MFILCINKYNNKVHRSIKIEPIDVTSDSYAEYNKYSNEKYPKWKVGDHIRISKFRNILAKGTLKIGRKKFLLLEKLRMLFRGLTLSVT